MSGSPLTTDDAIRYSYLSHLECSRCSRRYDADVPLGLCRCGAPLLARYDLDAAKASLTRVALAARPAELWRYHELLPIRAASDVVSLGEGWTPLLALHRLAAASGMANLYLKDDGALPTGTFKARGAAVGISRACELGSRRIAIPTNGNAGSAWAAYAARAGCECLVVMPEAAQPICGVECTAAGARLGIIKGSLADAAAIVGQLSEEQGWYNATTLREPYRIEGKKTIGWEIFEQLGGRVPDVILCPCGGGVALIAIHKAVLEWQTIGLLPSGKLPRLVAVQTTACAPIVRACNERWNEAKAWEATGVTLAFGTVVPKPLGDRLILRAIYASNGSAVAVNETELLEAQQALGASEGIFACPEGAATLAAARRLRTAGWIRAADVVVLLNTGSGLKYPNAVSVASGAVEPHDILRWMHG